MPAHLSSDQPQPKLKIDASEREQLWQLLREGGSKAIPDEMKAFIAGLQTAFGQYRQSAAEDFNPFYSSVDDFEASERSLSR